MFNSKYSKLLTGILIAAIIIIIGLLVFVGINWYQIYKTDVENEKVVNQFEDFIADTPTEEEKTTNNISPIVPNISNVQPNNNNTQNGGKKNPPKRNGYSVVATIEIPKTNVNLPVLDRVTADSLETSVGVLYGAGINEVGNTVIVGHNKRNGKFFSNNKKLEVGDKIYLKDTSGRKIRYIISSKFITDPEESDFFTRDTKGKRGIALSTCTDNSKQRLIILAEEG